MIYIIRMEGTNYHKIGIAENPKKRLSTLASGNPIQLKLIASFSTDEHTAFCWDEREEAEIHTELEAYRVRGEWFDLTEAQVRSIVIVLTDKYQHRPIWNQNFQRNPPYGYLPPFRHRSLLAHVEQEVAA